jgi:hypothetical protein
MRLVLPSCSDLVFSLFTPPVAKVYIMSFRTHDDCRPSKLLVLANNRKQAIKTEPETFYDLGVSF